MFSKHAIKAWLSFQSGWRPLGRGHMEAGYTGCMCNLKGAAAHTYMATSRGKHTDSIICHYYLLLCVYVQGLLFTSHFSYSEKGWSGASDCSCLVANANAAPLHPSVSRYIHVHVIKSVKDVAIAGQKQWSETTARMYDSKPRHLCCDLDLWKSTDCNFGPIYSC